MLFALIEYLIRRGMNPTRNEGGSEKASACDAVAEAAEKVGLRGVKKYETVRKIYFDLNPS
ncbi:MAG: hypothetical protein DRQ37_05765 [Gammaproteobacteria bacterium]|nr:MAG: hypothetical protein DRQ37_05765 [Gammaproteobacteria bacterium]